MISTNVNPAFRDMLTFISLTFLACGVNADEERLIRVLHDVHLLPFIDRVIT
jgi:hypothetical protein